MNLTDSNHRILAFRRKAAYLTTCPSGDLYMSRNFQSTASVANRQSYGQ